jgi:hypothetical protein
VQREPRLGLRPAHLLDDDSAATALDTAQRGFELDFPCAEVEVAPATRLQPVVAGALPTAARTLRSAAHGDLEDQHLATELVGLEPDLADRQPRERKQAPRYSLGAHRNFSGVGCFTLPASRSRCAFSPRPSISASDDEQRGRTKLLRHPQERQERRKTRAPPAGDGIRLRPDDAMHRLGAA